MPLENRVFEVMDAAVQLRLLLCVHSEVAQGSWVTSQ